MGEQRKIVLHDYAGHPFQVELSRALAWMGYQITHLYSQATVTGKGNLAHSKDDPSTLRIAGIETSTPYKRYHPVGRVRYETAYAKELIREALRARPDAVITCNTPLFVLRKIVPAFSAHQIPWIFWHQDIVSTAVADEIRRRVPAVLAPLAGRVVERYERRAVNEAAHVVPIGEFFRDKYKQWHARPRGVTVIPNWAPLDEIFPVHRSNAWAQRNLSDAGRFRILYAGTLGRKHDPKLLIDILDFVRDRGIDAELIVVSEGDGAEILRCESSVRRDVRILPFQPMQELRNVLGSADVLVGLLEPDASRFSVPSKVLSYLASGRATVLLAPDDNPAFSTVTDAGGFAAPPTPAGVDAAAAWISKVAESKAFQTDIGRSARSYAERHFAVDAVARRFAAIVDNACSVGAASAARYLGGAVQG